MQARFPRRRHGFTHHVEVLLCVCALGLSPTQKIPLPGLRPSKEGVRSLVKISRANRHSAIYTLLVMQLHAVYMHLQVHVHAVYMQLYMYLTIRAVTCSIRAVICMQFTFSYTCSSHAVFMQFTYSLHAVTCTCKLCA